MTPNFHWLVPRGQRGFILPWALMASLLGIFIVMPVVVLVGSNFLGHGQVEDQTRAYYAADAAIHAVIEDLIRGADGSPVPPLTYTAPAVAVGDIVPLVTVKVQESRTLSTLIPIDYKVASDPTLIQGFSPSGNALALAKNDDSFYSVTGSGDPTLVVFEVTSQVIAFSTVSFGDLRVVAQSNKSSTLLELFIFNPQDPAHCPTDPVPCFNQGYNLLPDVTEVLDLANAEETISVSLESADVAYLNSLSTKTVKIKVKATRTGGFRVDVDQIVFAITGAVSAEELFINDNPLLITGQLMSGSRQDLKSDDSSFMAMASASVAMNDERVEFEVVSETFRFPSLLSLTMTYVLRTNKDGVTVEVFVFNPTDPAHTQAGYNPEPDLVTTVPLNNTDKVVTLSVSEVDLAYLNSLVPISLKVKIRLSNSTSFRVDSDLILFTGTGLPGATALPAPLFKPVSHQYIDPGIRNPAMGQMAAKEGYLLRIYNVHPGLLKVNWITHTPDFKQAKGTILVFRGLVLDRGVVVPPGRITGKPPSQDNELLAAVTSRPGDFFIQTDYVEVERGLYTIVFFNDSANTKITDPFAPTGEKIDTWIYIPAFKDYLVDVRVGTVGLKAVVRQVPGPTEHPPFPWATNNINWIENVVVIQAWEPYGVQ